MLKVGLTGGIGSGKSTVARIFEVLGMPVYYADEAAKEIMNTDEELRRQVIQTFGDDAYTNNRLNRQYISSIVFKDKEKLALLNELVHPATIRAAEEWMSKQTTPYALKEAAIIFESGSDKQLDYVIGVHAPQEIRIMRTMQRDNITREEVIKRMNNQMDEEEKMELCNFVIENDERHALIPQVMAMHHQLITLQNHYHES